MTVYDLFHSLLDYECLLFHRDEWRTKNHCSFTELPYECRMKNFIWLNSPVLK
jgi:hypothetical protein